MQGAGAAPRPPEARPTQDNTPKQRKPLRSIKKPHTPLRDSPERGIPQTVRSTSKRKDANPNQSKPAQSIKSRTTPLRDSPKRGILQTIHSTSKRKDTKRSPLLLQSENPGVYRKLVVHILPANGQPREGNDHDSIHHRPPQAGPSPVSYTHLTLPTMAVV